MSSVKYTAEFHCIHRNGKEEDVVYYVDNKYQGIDNTPSQKQKKLNGYSRELFNIQNTN